MKFDVICGGVVEGVMFFFVNVDYVLFGYSLFVLLFIGMVFDVGLDGFIGKF